MQSRVNIEFLPKAIQVHQLLGYHGHAQFLGGTGSPREIAIMAIRITELAVRSGNRQFATGVFVDRALKSKHIGAGSIFVAKIAPIGDKFCRTTVDIDNLAERYADIEIASAFVNQRDRLFL